MEAHLPPYAHVDMPLYPPCLRGRHSWPRFSVSSPRTANSGSKAAWNVSVSGSGQLLHKQKSDQ
jgi:hypothetical protein